MIWAIVISVFLSGVCAGMIVAHELYALSERRRREDENNNDYDED